LPLHFSDALRLHSGVSAAISIMSVVIFKDDNVQTDFVNINGGQRRLSETHRRPRKRHTVGRGTAPIGSAPHPW